MVEKYISTKHNLEVEKYVSTKHNLARLAICACAVYRKLREYFSAFDLRCDIFIMPIYLLLLYLQN